MRGLVIKNTGSWYTVKTDDGRVIESKIKGNFRLKGIRSTNPVAVGDYVNLIINQEGTIGTGMGMWIINRTVADYNGSIDLSDNMKHTSGFYATIRLIKK